MTEGPALLELTGVSKRFGRITVAEGLSLRFSAGETVGIVGPNGAGKSTLFGIIAGDVRPDAGEVRFDGRSLARLDPAARCRLGIARTYQVPRPFQAMTVYENLLVAAYRGGQLSRAAGYELAARTLEETGLVKEANQPAGRLGLLQRKRLELARALATRPRIVLLDEVAGGLTDPEVSAAGRDRRISAAAIGGSRLGGARRPRPDECRQPHHLPVRGAPDRRRRPEGCAREPGGQRGLSGGRRRCLRFATSAFDMATCRR